MGRIYHCYKAVNQINNKVYIGFAREPEKRWSQHKRDAEQGRGYIFHDAIRKHGWENFKFEVICCGKNKREMLEFVEPMLIEQYHSSIGQNGYNMHRKVIGASGREIDSRNRKPATEETKRKLSASLQGNKRRLGCKDSKEVRKKKSEVLIGNLRSLGRIHPPEILDKIGDASKKMWEDRRVRGEKAPNGKLTVDQVKEIRALKATGMKQKDIAPKFGIHPMTVGEIVRREIWKHI